MIAECPEITHVSLDLRAVSLVMLLLWAFCGRCAIALDSCETKAVKDSGVTRLDGRCYLPSAGELSSVWGRSYPPAEPHLIALHASLCL